MIPAHPENSVPDPTVELDETIRNLLQRCAGGARLPMPGRGPWDIELLVGQLHHLATSLEAERARTNQALNSLGWIGDLNDRPVRVEIERKTSAAWRLQCNGASLVVAWEEDEPDLKTGAPVDGGFVITGAYNGVGFHTPHGLLVVCHRDFGVELCLDGQPVKLVRLVDGGITLDGIRIAGIRVADTIIDPSQPEGEFSRGAIGCSLSDPVKKKRSVADSTADSQALADLCSRIQYRDDAPETRVERG